MNIKLDPKHRLVSDKYNYIIEERMIREKGKDKGQEYWKQLSFHPKLHQAIESYSERFIRIADITTLDDLKLACASLRATLEDVKEVCSGQVQSKTL